MHADLVANLGFPMGRGALAFHLKETLVDCMDLVYCYDFSDKENLDRSDASFASIPAAALESPTVKLVSLFC